ncbi:hypothetical protein HDIA_0009 [Hartmannibacter diazotrophicus]|uniref:Lipoprotein n=1 Tax=Hartmannibacter diazotrophicus TaxID=1482074 RepID=A0A2C9CZW2_9HYPH|nr:hypothetical protein [Hartmannibacter diazotrophicus]SON53550.1 hypothetical protein HDIA_0009 [Hartmannibacter diazotrophicus]
MKKKLLLCALSFPLLLAACVGVPPQLPPSSSRLPAVENQKKDIGIWRNKGLISYEEAARRQYAIERSSYALRDSEVHFWNEAIKNAKLVDAHLITPNEYFRRVKRDYARDVGR